MRDDLFDVMSRHFRRPVRPLKRAPIFRGPIFSLGSVSGTVEATNADGRHFGRHFSVTGNILRTSHNLRDEWSYLIDKNLRDLAREIERHEPVDWNPSRENVFDLVTNIDPWQTPFLSLGTGIHPVQNGHPPEPATPIEPVPLSELLVGADFCSVERALEFIS